MVQHDVKVLRHHTLRFNQQPAGVTGRGTGEDILAKPIGVDNLKTSYLQRSVNRDARVLSAAPLQCQLALGQPRDIARPYQLSQHARQRTQRSVLRLQAEDICMIRLTGLCATFQRVVDLK